MDSFVIIPKDILEKIISNQDKLLNRINQLFKQKISPADAFEYITEADAQKLLNKRATWFWKQRTEGKIAFTKVGNTIYYRKEDINKLFKDNFNETF